MTADRSLEAGKSVVILSGGVDSTVALHHTKKSGEEVYALSFFYNQIHARELECAESQARLLEVPFRVIDISSVGRTFNSALVGVGAIPNIRDVLGDPQPSTYVPFRNLILLSIAFGYAESIDATKVVYGAQAHDLYGYWDTTVEFARRFQAVADQNRKHRIELYAPLIRLSKKEVVALGFELGVDFSQTWSCYRGEDRACLTCPTCAERLRAFELLGLKDPLDHRHNLTSTGTV